LHLASRLRFHDARPQPSFGNPIPPHARVKDATMPAPIPAYRRYFFISILLVTLGVVFTTTMKSFAEVLGLVFIAIGGVLFITAMVARRKRDDG
jgi:hypothetical protein